MGGANLGEGMGRMDESTLRRHLGSASSAKIGDVGEETVAAPLESRRDTVVALGDSGMPRNSGRQDLDAIAIVDGSLVAYEVKSRFHGRLAGKRTRAGDVPKPRLTRRRSRADGTVGFAQATRGYVLERVEQFIDVDDETDVEVRLVVVDLKVFVAQEYLIDEGVIGQ